MIKTLAFIYFYTLHVCQSKTKTHFKTGLSTRIGLIFRDGGGMNHEEICHRHVYLDKTRTSFEQKKQGKTAFG